MLPSVPFEILKSVVEAEFTTLKMSVCPVEPHAVSFEYGVDVPIPTFVFVPM